MSDTPKYVIIHDATGTEMEPGARFYDPQNGKPLLFHRWTEGASGQVYVEVKEVDDNCRLKTRKLHDLGLHAAQPIPVHKRDDAPSDYEKLLAGSKAVTEGLRDDYQKMIAEAAAQGEKSETKPTQVTLYVVDERGWVNTKSVEIAPEHSIDHIDISVDGVGLARLYPTTRSDK
jgi:hypothetical protein